MPQILHSVAKLEVDDVCGRFSRINTGAIADVMDEMGCCNQTLPWTIQGLTLDQTITGIAMPEEGETSTTSDPEENLIPRLKMLGDLEYGDVIVCQPQDNYSAHLGELSAEAARYRGARGAVIDGGTRDVEYILRLGFPVFCRYRTPLDGAVRWKSVSHGNPIHIGQVTIRRGDFIVADKDGVLAIPMELTLEVLRKAEEVLNTENLVRKAILESVHPIDLYRKYGRL